MKEKAFSRDGIGCGIVKLQILRLINIAVIGI
jgi:hypothetical protein